MKHYFTLSKFKLKYQDPIIPRIKNRFYKSKNYCINIFSAHELINPEIKKYFKSLPNKKTLKISKLSNDINLNENLRKKFKKNSNSLLLSNKIVDINYKMQKITDIINEAKNIYNKNIKFRKYNYMENLKLKKNKRNETDYNIFFDKENFLLLKSFNYINNKIRKNINEIIIKKKNHLSNSKLNNEFVNNSDKNFTKKIKMSKKINNINTLNKYENIRTNPNSNSLKNIAHSFLKAKTSLNCINSKLCFTYYIKDKILMNNYSNKNFLKYKKYIKFHK